jgi:predicted  nucleic acid-binding Zn-ribbon protein
MSTVSIVDQLKILIELQGLDAQIYNLKREKETKPKEVAALKAKQQENAKGVQALEAQYKAFEVKKKEKENELEQKETLIKKLQSQLSQCKTNKDYTTMVHEIEGNKADRSVIEEELIKMMDEADRLKTAQQGERQALKGKDDDIAKQIAQIEDQAKGLQKQIDELTAKRGEIAPKVDPKHLAKYERVLDRWGGVALVPVVNGRSCAGCNIVLPPQLVNEIMAGTRLIPCESCARILYIEPPSGS